MTLVRETELILRRSVAAQWGCAESKANERGNGGYRRDIQKAGVGKIRARKEGQQLDRCPRKRRQEGQ